MIAHDDPRWTAYALGELDGSDHAGDRAAVEAALAEDPAARALVEEIRADGALLTEALHSEPAVALTPEQRGAVLAAAAASSAPAGRLMVGAPWRRWVPLGVVGSAAAVLVALSLTQAGGGGSGLETLEATREFEPAKVDLSMTQKVNDEDSPLFGGEPATPGVRGQYELKSNEPGKLESLRQGAHFRGPAGTAPPALVPVQPPRFGPTQGFVPAPPPSVPPAGAAPKALAELLGGVGNPGAPVGPLPPPAASPRVSGFLVTSGDGDNSSTGIESSGGESYGATVESSFQRVAAAPLSTFSIDVDTASYAIVRRMLNGGQRPPADAVRIEEMLNYFPYADPAPKGDDPFAVKTEVAACPWNLKHRLVRIGVHGREIERKARPASNLVFLIDVSGSMDSPDKLPLVQASMRMLLEELNERDTVSIVVYAGASGLVLPPTSCEQKAVIQRAIDQMSAGGSTNGGAGLELAYKTAQQAFRAGGVNRVVLATDGDWNVGVTSQGGLLGLIQEKAKSGIFLTCLGYGMGNLKDSTLEMLADKGNGNYGYIDTTREARKVLVEGASGTLVTIAKDVKIQVEFNPSKVAAYRLVGYDNRLLAAKDFNDDTKDAGEIGAGHTVTALYEVVPVGVEDVPPAAPPTPEVDPLKYQGKGAAPAAPPAPVAAPAPGVPEAVSGEMLTVKLRFKQPDGQTSVKREFGLTDEGKPYEQASPDFKFASAVAAFALILKRSPYAGTASLEGVLELASEGTSFDPGGHRKEFLDLVARAIGMHLGK